jgi:hypothetical protein
MSRWRLPVAADDRHTFLAHALALSAAHGPVPWPDDGYPLPDQGKPKLMSDSVLDGMRTQHFGFAADQPAATQAADIIRAITESPPEIQVLQQLHDLLAEQDTLAIADALTEPVEDLDQERVREVGRWLAEQGTRRGAVAAGLVLIGLTGDERDRDLLLLLGSLDALTLYAVVALVRTQSDRDMAVFELARRVRAWGRIHAVRRLGQTTDPEIKAWLLREGFRNGIMNEYLAYTAATTGDLAGALAGSDVDDELLDAASDIIGALCAGGPAKDMSDYADAPVVIDRYLRHVRNRPSVRRIRAVLSLNQYLDDDRCQEVLTDLDWIAAVQQAIEGPDLDAFTKAIWPAGRLRLRVHEHAKAWLEKQPYDAYLWSSLEDVADAVTLAERLLPLKELANGPAKDDGFGVEYQADRALDCVVDRVARQPGHGWPLVRTALANRVIRSRNTAVRVLKSWPRDQLPDEAPDTLRQAVDAEPDDDVRKGMTELLQMWQSAA